MNFSMKCLLPTLLFACFLGAQADNVELLEQLEKSIVNSDLEEVKALLPSIALSELTKSGLYQLAVDSAFKRLINLENGVSGGGVEVTGILLVFFGIFAFLGTGAACSDGFPPKDIAKLAALSAALTTLGVYLSKKAAHSVNQEIEKRNNLYQAALNIKKLILYQPVTI